MDCIYKYLFYIMCHAVGLPSLPGLFTWGASNLALGIFQWLD